MNWAVLCMPSLFALWLAGFAAWHGNWDMAVLAAIAGLAGTVSVLWLRHPQTFGTRTIVLAANPELLEQKRNRIAEELGVLENAQDLQRSVFEVSAELVGCVEEADARVRFAAAVRRYWSCAQVDLLVWERGSWRSLGGAAAGAPPTLGRPVALPQENSGDLVLDLSPGVDGQAALVLRNAQVQPSLEGRSIADQRYVAEVLRTQLSLSLRRVTLYASLQSLARIDPLTNTHRRWYGEARLNELVEGGEVVTVAMVDIDLFKRVNDDHGHAAGDAVLRAIGHQLVAQVRTGDLVCRYGGEEFLVILPDTPLTAAHIVAERLRAGISALTGLVASITASIGLAACFQDDTVAGLINRADEALYEAKTSGRNRVVIAQKGKGSDRLLRTTSRKKRSADALGAGSKRWGRDEATPLNQSIPQPGAESDTPPPRPDAQSNDLA